MGLDSVEILVKVENTFGIQISNAEAERIVTVGDYYNVVWKHVANRQSEKCQSQALFYKLRKSLASSFPLSAGNIRLDVRTDTIFPKQNRCWHYLQFAENTSLQLPALVLPAAWETLLTAFGFTTILGGLLASLVVVNFTDFTKWTLLFPVVGVGLTKLFSNLLNHKRTVIPSTTIREFTKEILTLNYATITQKNGINRNDMESVINHILVDMVGVELHEISPEKSLTDDLGID